ncbi:MAG: Bax inhibitor-1/YccA family protein [Alphaproteobacteria bacterium]|uniref:Bax inhibitor-1/YccA family protein n=1 Tax=Methylocystis sp. B8 TaxID=544938 RepID=UPI0010FF0EDC|nr:Bax inhibitor-1/YccA family protein [Methylocystis sp. B8]MBM3577213.1 Bax inhibitor-1/YccA family protein [Alphaproteobacteria bacterium]MBM3640617.1 Bax inhibitor-1/YccA family protein [Alphaproteobacteria bacterium]TLG78210.1 Bax inhibitor-1/YccA family protein [Methylocystis sp. B8]
MSNFDRNTSFGYGRGVARPTTAEIDQGLRAYMLGVYNYMTLGLGVTGLVALGTYMLAVAKTAPGAIALTPFGQMLYTTPLRWVVILSPLAFVFFIGARANTISAATARNLFIAFAAVMGLSMSSLLLVFTGVSVARIFFITAAAFGGLSLYGYMTQRDLSAFGSFLVMGVWGLVIAGLVNLFLQSTGLQFALSIIAVLVFAGLTAWDTQNIKDMYYAGDGYEVAQKKSVFGALSLYLDFINMFQSLLFLFGQRND